VMASQAIIWIQFEVLMLDPDLDQH
jgi:hypothetical protein